MVPSIIRVILPFVTSFWLHHQVVTAYCDVGTMADGNWTYWGAAGGTHWIPFGTHVLIPDPDSSYRSRLVVVEDRGAPIYDIDIAMPGDCQDARKWGRVVEDIEVFLPNYR